MIDEKKLMWARLSDTADTYIVSIVDEQIKHRNLGAKMFGIDSAKIVDHEKICLEVIELCMEKFTLDEVKKAVGILMSKGYNLSFSALCKINEELGQILGWKSFYTTKGFSQNIFNKYIQSHAKPHRKSNKSYSNKYYEQYRK